MYTSGCPKNQNRCSQSSGDPSPCRCNTIPFTHCLPGTKNAVPACRSHISKTIAANSTLNARIVSIAAVSQPHTVIGIRWYVMPSHRHRTTVTTVFTAPSVDATQNTASDTSHKSMPNACPGPAAATALSGGYADQPPIGAPPGTRNAASSTTSDAAVSQNPAAFTSGSAISRDPSCSGNTTFANPDCGATVSTKNTISVPCIVTHAR